MFCFIVFLTANHDLNLSIFRVKQSTGGGDKVLPPNGDWTVEVRVSLPSDMIFSDTTHYVVLRGGVPFTVLECSHSYRGMSN